MTTYNNTTNHYSLNKHYTGSANYSFVYVLIVKSRRRQSNVQHFYNITLTVTQAEYSAIPTEAECERGGGG